MRKMLIMGAIALILLLALPGAVSADTTDTVVVSGSIGGSISVTVPATADFGLMSGTAQKTLTEGLEVTTTYSAWHVDASDAKTTDKGYMVDETAGKLTNAFELSNDDVTYNTLTTSAFSNFAQMTTDGAGTHKSDIYLQQVIDAGDEAGTNYQITITFTGAAN